MARILYGLAGKDKTKAFSPHVWKVQMALAHKGLDYELKPLSFLQVKEIEEVEQPKVPILIDGDEVIADSFQIAQYLDKTYPENPLMGGAPGIAMTKFMECWSNTQLHPLAARIAVVDIHNMLDENDQTYFRTSREGMFKTTLEDFCSDREAHAEKLAATLKPLEMQLGSHDFLGGKSPIFADYIIFGALQWLRMTATLDVIPSEGAVADWFNRLLDMYDGLGRKASSAL